MCTSSSKWDKKLENFLNRKIRAAPLAAAPHICISSELFPSFLFYLATPRHGSVQWALLCHLWNSIPNL